MGKHRCTRYPFFFSVLLTDAYSQSSHFHTVCSRPVFPFFQTVQCPLLDSRIPPFTKNEGQSCEKTGGSVKDAVNAKTDEKCDTGWAKKVCDVAFCCSRNIKSFGNGAPAQKYSISVLQFYFIFFSTLAVCFFKCSQLGVKNEAAQFDKRKSQNSR